MSSITFLFSQELTQLKPKDKELYKAASLEWIFSQIYRLDKNRLLAANQWSIRFWDSYESNLEIFKALTDGTLNQGIPHGVTNVDAKTVDVFISNLSGDLSFRFNMEAVLHELDHMLLAIYYGKRRARRRYDDKNARAGTEGNFYTTEVHDRKRETELKLRKTKSITVKRKRFMNFGTVSITVHGIDVSDLCDERNLDRPQ